MKNYASKNNAEKKQENSKPKPEKVLSSTDTDTEVTKKPELEDEEILKDIEIPVDNRGIQVEDPLIEAEPIQQGYSAPDVIGGNIENAPDIPEEIIERPVVDLSNPSKPAEDSELWDKDSGSSRSHIQDVEEIKEPTPTIGNPKLDDASKKEKDDASGHLAETIIDGYDMAHQIVLGFLLKDEKKLMKQALKGKIELEAIDSEIEVGGKTFRMKDLLSDYNRNLIEALTVEDEFKEKITPLIKQELARHNVGMTPMQRIVALVVKDLQPKLIEISQLANNMNTVIKQQSEIIKAKRSEVTQQQQSTPKGHTITIEDDPDYGEPEEIEVEQVEES